jgi:protein-S-isoprenylcysteine O-methyltransferase Ste14
MGLGLEITALVVSTPAIVLHLIAWVIWFSWLGWGFPRGAERIRRVGASTAYKTAFTRHIFPGVCFGVSRISQPLAHALVNGVGFGHPAAVIAGVLLALIGAILIISGFRAIGVAAAGFYYEFVKRADPILICSVYARLRHPLFLGAVTCSSGLALATGDPAVLALAFANVAVLPVYRVLEDRRSVQTFGLVFARYRNAVNAFFPSAQRRRPNC